jgi:hypothetical protein
VSAGHTAHRHDELPKHLLAQVTPQFLAKVERLVKRAHVVTGYDNPWLVGRSTNMARLYPDRDLPHMIDVKGKKVDAYKTTARHEVAEWLMMDDGMSYLPAHKIANHVEREYVERTYGDIWKPYCSAMDDYIKEAEHEKVRRVPADLDLRMFEDEHDVAHLKELKAAMRKDNGQGRHAA